MLGPSSPQVGKQKNLKKTKLGLLIDWKPTIDRIYKY